MTAILKAPAEYAQIMVDMYSGDRDSAAVEFMTAIRNGCFEKMPGNWLADTFRQIVGLAPALPADATDLMRHWFAVDAILAAAGQPRATFGEVRHKRNDEPMVAAWEIFDDRRETSKLTDPLWSAGQDKGAAR